MTEVTIVGGGLAGMAAALRLLEHKYPVTLFEASSRLGGKAGSIQYGHDYNDHGYHIFPLWYRNVWQLVDELGIQDKFIDCTNFNQLRVGEFPEFKTLQNAGSIQYFWQNLNSGVLPVPEMFIFTYACLDLMSQPLRRKAFLDQIAVSGFIHSRPYRTERVAKEFQELILKSISVPTYLVSAMTMKTVLEYQVRNAVPLFRILRGNLQEYFIEPFHRRLQDLGCEIFNSQTLERLDVEGTRVTKLHFRDQAGKVYERKVDKVILAIPAEQLAKLLDDSIYVVDPELFNVRYLRSLPMAAINLYFKSKIPGIPKDHLDLRGSRFGLSLIDVSQTWEGYDTTVLNVIAADFTTLETLSAEEAIDQIVKELIRFLPVIERDEIDTQKTSFQPHLGEPLFMNDVGAWLFRPASRTGITNLYLAGDYCRSHVDLVSMEGAITTGVIAAKALLENSGLKPRIRILKPAIYPRWLLFLAKLVLFPLAMLAKLASLMSRAK